MTKWLITYFEYTGNLYLESSVREHYQNRIITCEGEYPTEAELRKQVLGSGRIITFMQRLGD